VLKCVTAAEHLLVNDKSLNKEYLKQRGDPDFCKLAAKLLFGKVYYPF
jgi:aspartate/tyrosine/aromatic aminotransferase